MCRILHVREQFPNLCTQIYKPMRRNRLASILIKKNEVVIRTTVEFPDRGTRGQSPLHFLDVVVFWKNML